MKIKSITYALLGFLLAFNTISCQTPEKKVENAQEKVEDAQQDLTKAQEKFNTEYQNFKLETENRILENENKIKELKEQRLKVKKNNRKIYDEKITELSQKNDDLRTQLNEYKYDGNEKWESFKKEFNHDMDELGASLKNLFKDNVKE